VKHGNVTYGSPYRKSGIDSLQLSVHEVSMFSNEKPNNDGTIGATDNSMVKLEIVELCSPIHDACPMPGSQQPADTQPSAYPSESILKQDGVQPSFFDNGNAPHLADVVVQQVAPPVVADASFGCGDGMLSLDMQYKEEIDSLRGTVEALRRRLLDDQVRHQRDRSAWDDSRLALEDRILELETADVQDRAGASDAELERLRSEAVQHRESHVKLEAVHRQLHTRHNNVLAEVERSKTELAVAKGILDRLGIAPPYTEEMLGSARIQFKLAPLPPRVPVQRPQITIEH